MPHDEESGLALVDEKDYAAPPPRQGTFSQDNSTVDARHFLPQRTGTGLASISQPHSAPGTRPSSLVGSLASVVTNVGNPRPDQSHAEPTTKPISRPTSSKQASVKIGTRPSSFEESSPSLAQSPAPTQGPPPSSEDVPEALPHPVEEAGDVEFGRWLVEQFRKDLFDIYRDQRPGKDNRPHLLVNLAALNRMRMRKLQVKLVQEVLRMRYEKTEPKGWEDLLEQYINATRDNDFIRTCVHRDLDDPFIVITERLVDASVFRSLLNTVPEEQRRTDGLESVTEKTFAPPVEKTPQPIGGTRLERTQKQKTEEFFKRLAFSLVGGVFLIAPMWLMVLHNTKYTALVATSVSVVLCGMVTAWKLEQPHTVLSTTAAYAAVLVVFVGTNIAPAQKSN